MGSLGVSLAAWLLVPAVACVAALGYGLLAERVARTRLPVALLTPVGLCAAIVVAYAVYRLGAGVAVAAPVVVLGAVAGLLVGRRELRARVSPGLSPGLAAAATYALYLAPVVFAGGWTWTGYNFVNDTAVQFILADHLAQTGTSDPVGPPETDPWSTTTEHIRLYFSSAYPLGSHGLIATLAAVTRVPIEAAYNPVIATLMAAAAMSLTDLARRSGLAAPAAAAAAFVALAANLTYHYALQGNVKEIAMLATLAIGAAVARHALDAERPVAVTGILAVCAAAMVSVYSAAAVPYALALAALLFASALLARRSTLRRRLLPAVALGAAVAVVAALPALPTLVTFGEAARGTFGGADKELDLGHLLRPLELKQMAGVWLWGEYRLPVPPHRELLTTIGIAVVLCLAVAGAISSLWRREPGPLLYAGAAAIAFAVVAPRTSPYADGKMLALLSPGVLLLAGFGAAAACRLWRPAGYTVAAVAAAGVIWSDAYAYHDVQLAPIDRMKAMEDIADRVADERQLVLVSEADEFAKYFMRDARINVATAAVTPRQVELIVPQVFGARWFDLDEYRHDYVDDFDVVVTRRSPSASRPPGNYELTDRNRYYEVWRDRGRPVVEEHLGAYTLNHATDVLPCADIRRIARRAGHDGGRLLVARRTEEPQLDPLLARRTWTWVPDGIWLGNVTPVTPGEAEGDVKVRGGRYRVWLRGSFGRDIRVQVDGRVVGTAKGVNSPRQWHLIGARQLAPGTHRVRMEKGGGSLEPGDGFDGYLGPVAFEPVAPPPVTPVEPSRARRLCGSRVDWIERVRLAG